MNLESLRSGIRRWWLAPPLVPSVFYQTMQKRGFLGLYCNVGCCCRHAFAEEYALTAGKVAEQMAKVRAEEVAARDLFRAAVDHYVPNALIT